MTTTTTRALAIVASSYARRKLERVYDNLLGHSRLGAQLRGLTPLQKRGVELALYAATALVDARVPERSAIAILLKQALIDAGPELARRILADAGHDIVDLENLLARRRLGPNMEGAND